MPGLHPTDGPVQDHFGLTYANYLVLPRTLLQSMPIAWQTTFVQHLDQMAAAFNHVPQAEAYEVTTGTERDVSELTSAELKRTGYSADWYGGETAPAGATEIDLIEWAADHETDPVYYDRDLNEIPADTRVLLPGDDPVPHYNRGRTYIEPSTTTAPDVPPQDLPTELLEKLIDVGNKALNDYFHERACACSTWPVKCASWKAPGDMFFGYWDTDAFAIGLPAITAAYEQTKRWWARDGLTLRCTCGDYQPIAGTTREQEDAHREHRVQMGETVKPRALTKVERLEAEVRRLSAENERLADVLNADDQPLLCPSCVCADCGGREGQHTPGGACSCGCRPACDRFQRDSQLDLLRDAVTPLLGDHPLAEAAAHRVWHALNPAPTTEG